MMIPLRKPMIIEQPELRFPEGVACAEVLKAGDRGGAEMLGIFTALGIGGAFKVLVDVVGVFKGRLEVAFTTGKSAFYAGTDVSPMLAGVGFIVGYEISLLIFMGGAISYVLAIPVLAWGMDFAGQDMGTLVDTLGEIWNSQIRYFGIGAMVVAGVYSIVKIGGSMGAAIKSAARGVRGLEDTSSLPRTEQGITGKALFSLLLGSMILSSVVYYIMTQSLAETAITTVLLFVLAFFFVAVASYIVGLVGSSNSPVSGMAICTVLVTAGFLLVLGYTGEAGMLATLGVAGVVCCAASTAGDICQDLKIGQIVGATPRSLQIGEIFGTVVPAFIIAPTMVLLHQAYGIGEAVREGTQPLQAPQGVMFQKLVGGLFGAGDIPWDLVGWGAGVGVAAIVLDRFVLQPRNAKFRLYPMPLAVGMYLPWTVTTPILIGGVVYKIVESRSRSRGDSEEVRQSVIHRGLLFSSGLVAGEAIMGIVIALLVVAEWFPMPLLSAWVGGALTPVGVVDVVSALGFAFMMWLLFRKAMQSPK
jgi:putative OPT family oligopeptide transporter